MTISRASGSITFPANFTLIAAMNPCPHDYHGYHGDLRTLSLFAHMGSYGSREATWQRV